MNDPRPADLVRKLREHEELLNRLRSVPSGAMTELDQVPTFRDLVALGLVTEAAVYARLQQRKQDPRR
jgi:hypothetical protein